jgi:hypothetical protein
LILGHFRPLRGQIAHKLIKSYVVLEIVASGGISGRLNGNHEWQFWEYLSFLGKSLLRIGLSLLEIMSEVPPRKIKRGVSWSLPMLSIDVHLWYFCTLGGGKAEEKWSE